jgi:hypothetical protein
MHALWKIMSSCGDAGGPKANRCWRELAGDRKKQRVEENGHPRLDDDFMS